MPSTWLNNLNALQQADPATAQLLESTPPTPGIEWTVSKVPNMPAATIPADPSNPADTKRITLASKFSPDQQARKLADTADLSKHAVIVVVGFALGYHIRFLAERAANRAVLIIYEPDPALLRATLEQHDFANLIQRKSIVILTGPLNDSDLTRRLEPQFGAIAQGVQYVTHPVTRQHHAETVRAFMDQFAKLVAFCRTNVATTLANAAVTCRNLAANLAHYSAGPTVNDLHNAAAGKPAIVVAAGPSLAKNIRLLTDPAIRQNAVIITAQTMLRPLLEWGITPHYVTALDYHEISKRFYENLPPQAADITLVAEPKSNPAILDSFPGPVRILHNRFLDVLLGPLAKPITPITPGSTVAHLSFYLAQHLGYDPIILTGQDLGFSLGLYYCPGTAIHDVWAPELNTFNTLEMMEWKRVARHRALLRKRQDIHGNPIYTDDQMLTYLAQFERDFASAPQSIIDATEGGLPKQHTTQSTLADAIAQHLTSPLPQLPPASRSLNPDRLTATADFIRTRIQQVGKLQSLSRKTIPVLESMKTDQRDPTRMPRHFEKLNDLHKQVAQLNEAFELVNSLNQVGAFNRQRADRAIRVDESNIDPYERQSRQLDRDIQNITWIIEGAGETLNILNESLTRISSHQNTAASQPSAQNTATVTATTTTTRGAA